VHTGEIFLCQFDSLSAQYLYHFKERLRFAEYELFKRCCTSGSSVCSGIVSLKDSNPYVGIYSHCSSVNCTLHYCHCQFFLVCLFQALCCAVGQTSSKRNLVFVLTLLRRLSELLLFCRVVYGYLIFYLCATIMFGE